MPTFTAQYRFIQIALATHERSFADLEARMDKFEPLPREAFQMEWQRLWDQMRPINDGTSDDDLRTFVDSQISTVASASFQYTNTFYKDFTAEAITITILSHALVEATINTVLALGLHHVRKTELFVVLEQANVKHKWTAGPQAFLPSYSLERSGSLYEGLSILCRRRNSYLHSKITLRDPESRVLLEGSGEPGISIDRASRFLLRRFLDLPYALHQSLLSQVGDNSLRFQLESVLRKPIDACA